MKLREIGIASLAALITSSSGAFADEFNMRVSYSGSPKGMVCTKILQPWGAKIQEESEGRIDVEVICGSALTKYGNTITRVSEGVVEAGFDLPNVYGAQFAHWGVVGIPGLVEDPMAAAAAIVDLQNSGAFPETEGFRIAIMNVNGNNAIWLRDEVDSITDLNGVKIAAGASMRGNTVAELGGVPLALRLSEYYQSLAKGAADGLLTNTTAVTTFGFWEQVPHGYFAPFGAGHTVVVLNEDWYQSLPDDLKAVIDANSGAETSLWGSQLFWDEAILKSTPLVEEGKMFLHQLSEEQLAELEPAFEAVKNKWLEDTENGAAYLEAFTAAYEARLAE